MKIAIYTLYQNKEFDRFKIFLLRVSQQLSTHKKLFILVNDRLETSFISFCREVSPYIEVFSENRNLGVASGRNFLLNKCFTWGADLFVSCDNDIIFPNDYLEEIKDQYEVIKSYDNNVGIMQPLLLDGRKLKNYFGVLESWKDSERILLDSDFISSKLLSDLGAQTISDCSYHAGISNMYRAHFGLSSEEITSLKKESFFSTYSLLSDRKLLAKKISEVEHERIMTCAGGISIIPRSVIEHRMRYDPRFDPFLYEDSELGFKAALKGFNSYLITKCFTIHDFFLVGENRTRIQKSYIARLRMIELKQEALKVKNMLLSKTITTAFSEAKAFAYQSGCNQKSFFHYLISYLINLIYGAGQRAESFDEMIARDDFLRYMFSGLDIKYLTNISFPVSNNISLAFGELKLNIRENIGIHGFNVRLEKNGKNTRYFDFYIRFKHCGKNKYILDLDLQSDDLMQKLSIQVDFYKYCANPLVESPVIKILSSNFKKYDYGNFSKEELYPTPDFQPDYNTSVVIEEMKRFFGSGSIHSFICFCEKYMENKLNDVTKDIEVNSCEPKKIKVLIYTDSRGQHIPDYSHHTIFTQRLAEHKEFDVDCVLCPMKWTTILDFIEYSQKNDLTKYDAIILYTGIVDWSPRPSNSAKNELYSHRSPKNLGNELINTSSYSKKVINNKTKIFDEVFSSESISSHLNTSFDEEYQGQKTINMYSLEMAEKNLIPKLNEFDNLIFINSNPFVSGWKGDYQKQRPANMSVTELYSSLFSKKLTSEVIDISCWDKNEVKLYTCDNLHLSSSGSDYLYHACLKVLDRKYIKKHSKSLSIKDALKFVEEGNYEDAISGLLQRVSETDNIGANLSFAFQFYIAAKTKGEPLPPVISRSLKRYL